MIRLTVNWTGLNEGVSLWHFDGDTTAATGAAAAATTFLQALDNHMHTAQLWSLDPEVPEISVTTGQIIGQTTITSTSGAGVGAGTPVPQVAQLLIRWRTGAFLNGREIRGRTFVPGLSSVSQTATGEVTSTVRSQVDAAAATFLSNSEFGIYSPSNAAFAEASTGQCWVEFAAMRSRRD